MEKRERYKRLIMFLASVLIIGLQTATFAATYFSYYNTGEVIGRRFYFYGHIALFGLYAIMLVAFSKLFGAFRVGYMRVLDVMLGQYFSVIIANVMTYFQMALIGRWTRMAHVGPMIRVTVINLALVTAWVVVMRWIYCRIFPPRETLVIYGDHSPEDMIAKISVRKDKYIIREAVKLDQGMDYIKERMREYHTVILGDIPSHERNQLVKYCFEQNIRCYCSPKISDIMIMSSEKIHMFDTPLLLFRNRGLTVEQQAYKRCFDLVCSLLGLVVASPVMLIIALLIKLYDGGPVLYTQDRLTKDGRVFQVYKFRSMRVDSEKAGARLAMKDDDRITPVGRVLRNIHFDELPQLFNIIKGDMSLVGPRPERPSIAAEYTKEIPEFSYRLKVKAGLTGYAQVFGKYNTTPYDKLKLDLTYIENYSFLLDLQLIATTFKIVFQKENAEGVEQWQVTAATKERQPAEEKTTEPDEENGPLVSVIIPAYRCAKTIGRTLDSVLEQDVPMEVLVLNDQSPDELDAVMESYAGNPAIRYIHNPENLGAAGSRNRGVSLARGRYVAFVDADDWWDKDKLKKQLAVMEREHTVLCCTARELATPEGGLTGRVIPVKERLEYRDLLTHNSINCSSVVLLRKVAAEFPMCHEDSHEDYIAWLRVLEKYGTASGINEPLLKYRLSSKGKSGNKLNSARMTFKVYRYMGFGLAKSCWCFLQYTFNGIRKYGKALYGKKQEKNSGFD